MVVLFGTANINGIIAKADGLDAADLCLVDTIELMVDEEIQTLSYNRKELYNYELEPIGYGYETNINGKIGYIQIIKKRYHYEVTELYLNKLSPYIEIEGLPVYLTPLCYIEYINEQFIDIENGLPLDKEQLHYLNEKGFGYENDGYENSGTGGEIVKDVVRYDSRTVDEGKISGGVPKYFDENPALTGTCAVQAGSVVVGYYGRYFPNLTPGFTVGMELPPSYFYFNQGNNGVIQGVINDLYVKMGTNIGGAGTTATGFRNGLAAYVQSKGQNISYTSVSNNNALNYDLYKLQVANLKPSVLFFNTYNVIKPPAVDKIDNNTDGIERKVYPGMHVMIGYGYKKYNYFKDGSNFRTDTYLEVYSGVLDCAQGFVKLYDMSILVEAYAINIY